MPMLWTMMFVCPLTLKEYAGSIAPVPFHLADPDEIAFCVWQGGIRFEKGTSFGNDALVCPVRDIAVDEFDKSNRVETLSLQQTVELQNHLVGQLREARKCTIQTCRFKNMKSPVWKYIGTCYIVFR